MARRKKTSPVEDLISIVALLPWWVGLLLAVVSYLILHQVALQPAATSVQPGQIGDVLVKTVSKTAASFGQYILPLICIGGAGVSAWKRREQKGLITNVAESKAANVLDSMSWQQFEQLVGEAFRLKGYSVVETGGGGADGGIDLVLSKGSEKFLVQCKQWKAFKVGVDVVRELYGVMAAKGATGGFVVTSGRFTAEATAFASGRNVTLIDGPGLHELIQTVRSSKPLSTPRHEQVPRRPEPALNTATEPHLSGCPLCSKPMVRRLAKRGVNAGNEFWGCTGYPSCKGTKPIASARQT